MNEIGNWLDQQRLKSRLTVKPIPFAECIGWQFDKGALVHQSGGFFSVRGCRYHRPHPGVTDVYLPMIDQPEVGLLGFVFRKKDHGWEWLLQAKTEPGNVGGTQIGPSVQATESNWMRRHGGKPTPMLDLFATSCQGSELITDIKQSEQGDRFLGKYNRNAVVRVGEDVNTPDGGIWRWFPAEQLLVELGNDYVVNTDSRSVLWCSNWNFLLAPGQSTPFGRWRGKGGFGEALLNSVSVPINQPEDQSGYFKAVAMLKLMRCNPTTMIELLPLDALEGWSLNRFSLSPDQPAGAAHSVRAISVQAEDREVTSWCQPILASREEQRVVLLCSLKDDVLHFALNLSAEPGFREGIQFSPSLVTGVGHENPAEWLDACTDPKAIIRAETRQSDEGGRFLSSIALYQILEVPSQWISVPVSHGVWVTLSAARRMSSASGLLNNELRSALSVLLSWL